MEFFSVENENERFGGKLRFENDSSKEKVGLRIRLLNFQEWESD